MRLFITLINALNKIKNSIDKDDIEGAKIQISNAYQLLDNDSSFFLTTELDNILLSFKEQEGNYLKRVQMLAELMHYDSLTQSKKETKKRILEKSIQLLEYYTQITKEFSFDLINKLKEMKNELKNTS